MGAGNWLVLNSLDHFLEQKLNMDCKKTFKFTFLEKSQSTSKCHLKKWLNKWSNDNENLIIGRNKTVNK